ncbi:MAG: hypothetical protein U0744_10625 [Gemmataceae bacterium]
MKYSLATCTACITAILLWASGNCISRARMTDAENPLDDYDLELQSLSRSFTRLRVIEIDVASGRISLEDAILRVEPYFATGRRNCSVEQFRGRSDRERIARMICGWMVMTTEIACPHYRDLTVARLHVEFESLFPSEEALPYSN